MRQQISLERLRQMAEDRFGDLVKGVVDIERQIMAVSAELHSDEEAALLDDGSCQTDLWGINLYPGEWGTDGWLEFDSMINVRPSQGNRTRSVDNPETRDRIIAVVNVLVRP